MKYLFVIICLTLVSACSKHVETKTSISVVPPKAALLCNNPEEIADKLMESSVKLSLTCKF